MILLTLKPSPSKFDQLMPKMDDQKSITLAFMSAKHTNARRMIAQSMITQPKTF